MYWLALAHAVEVKRRLRAVVQSVSQSNYLPRSTKFKFDVYTYKAFNCKVLRNMNFKLGVDVYRYSLEMLLLCCMQNLNDSM